MLFPLLLIVSALAQAGGATSPPPRASFDDYGPACPAPPGTSAADLVREAERLRAARRQPIAMECYARAARQAAGSGEREAEQRARLSFAQAAYSQSLYALARAEAGKARTLAADGGDRLNAARADQLLGAIAQMTGDAGTAMRQFRAALAVYEAVGSDRDRVRALLDIERLSNGREEKLAVLNDAIATARRIEAPDLEAAALHSRADWNYGAGRFDAALTDLNEAIARFEQIGARADLADAYVSLGRLLRAHGRAADALPYYDKAAALERAEGDLRGLAQSTNAKAVALNELGRKKEALAAYQQALEFARQTGSPRIINFQQGNLAAAYASTGDYTRSNRLLRDVLAVEHDPYILAYRYGAMAENYLALGKPSEAAPNIEKAVENARSSNNSEFMPSLLYTSALTYRALHRYDEALDAASEAVQVVEKIRAKLVPLDFLKRGYGETWQSIFGLTVALLNERGDASRALVVSEQARARAFLDLLASRGLADPAPAATGALGSGQLSSAATASTADVESIMATATRLRSTIVSYWVADDETFVWVTAPGGPVRSRRIAVKRSALEALVSQSMQGRGAAATTAFTRLHRLLISPIAPWLKGAAALTIVPHATLARLSFAALRDARGNYLIEQHAITYAPSISTLLLTARRAEQASSNSEYLLVADPRPMPDARPALAPLPASRREVQGIARAVGRPAAVLTGAGASEAAVRERAADARVLHLATHGVIRDDAPLDSYLAMAAAGPAPSNDGRLTVRELYDLRLSADLVVLSACRTASGRTSGEGIAGLSRAFFYAGTPSVVATLWEVADEPSATLMTAFYRHWRAGMTKRAALRQAQLDLIRSLRGGQVTVRVKNGVVPLDEHPFYWAGYILVGEPE